jgi:hypothetical protein
MVRLATVVVGLLTGIFPMAILYVVVAMVVPERGFGVGDRAAEVSVGRPGNGALILGVILIVIGAAGFGHEVLRIDTDVLWPIGLIAIGAAFVVMTLRR